MRYFLKLLGLRKNGLPEIWWDVRTELKDGVFFSSKPRKISIGDRLIYYAVGGSKRVVAEAEVIGEATQEFQPPPDWSPERQRQFSWRMPVQLLCKGPATDAAPRVADFYTKPITGGPYRGLTDAQGKAMAEAIRSAKGQPSRDRQD